MATGAPGTNGVWLYGEDDNEATFSELLNKAGTTVNTQLGVDRGRLTTLEARPVAGLIPVVPSSIVIATGSGSINSLGVVTFTGATAVSLNGAFTATYRNYLIKYEIGSTATTEFRWRVRSAGVDNIFYYSQAGYRAYVGGGSSSFSGINMAQASMGDLNGTAEKFHSGRLELSNPYNTTVTTTQGHHSGFLSGTGFEMVLSSALKEDPYAYDGITFFPAAGNVTGTIQVFGYND